MAESIYCTWYSAFAMPVMPLNFPENGLLRLDSLRLPLACLGVGSRFDRLSRLPEKWKRLAGITQGRDHRLGIGKRGQKCARSICDKNFPEWRSSHSGFGFCAVRSWAGLGMAIPIRRRRVPEMGSGEAYSPAKVGR